MRAIRNSCGICMGSVKNPKVISCHHSFCSKCLDDYVRVKLHNGRFDCPVCRTSVELPKGGVSKFQANIHSQSDFVGNFICDLCGPQSVACRRCLDCNENFCMSCCHAHEKSKASRDHKIIDLGTLDPRMKGKIRQRIFCDQHPEKDLELICRACNLLICVLCKAVKHDHHSTNTIADAAAEVKKTLQTKMNSCSEKLQTIAEFKRSVEEFNIKINDAERTEIQALEDQRLQLIKVLDQEFAKMKDKIQIFYKDLMQQNSAFIRSMQDEFNTYSDANFNTRKLIEQGSDIDVIKKGQELEQLISTAVSKTYLTPDTTLGGYLFSPANFKPSEIISLIGVMREPTKLNIEEREKALREEREKKEREDREKRQRASVELPKTWNITKTKEEFKVVHLSPTSTEYTDVKELFANGGCPFKNIIQIIRVENRTLYIQYHLKKLELESRNPKVLQNELILFHGTSSDTIPKVNQGGYDRNYCGKNGAYLDLLL